MLQNLVKILKQEGMWLPSSRMAWLVLEPASCPVLEWDKVLDWDGTYRYVQVSAWVGYLYSLHISLVLNAKHYSTHGMYTIVGG